MTGDRASDLRRSTPEMTMLMVDMWTANCLIRPAGPDAFTVVPDTPERRDEAFDGEVDPGDEGGEAGRQG
jgi:hypothetical protein